MPAENINLTAAQEEELKFLRRTRDNIQRQITNFTKLLKTNDTNSDIYYLEAAVETLQSHWSRFNNIQFSIESLSPTTIEKDKGFDIQHRYHSAVTQYRRITCPTQNSVKSPVTTQISHQLTMSSELSQKDNEIAPSENSLKYLESRANCSIPISTNSQNLPSSIGKTQGKGKMYNTRPQFSKGAQTFVANSDAKPTPLCPICAQSHRIYSCPTFSNMTSEQRNSAVSKASLCYNCLGARHGAKNCSSTGRCQNCGKKHHSLLHKTQNTPTSNRLETDISRFPTGHFASLPLDTPRIDLIPTVRLLIKNSNRIFIPCRTPLDTGLSANFITRNLAESLNVLSALSTHRASASIKSRLDNFEKTLQFLVVPRIDSLTPLEQLNHSSIALLKNLKLANSEFDKPAPLQMTIGSGISLATLAIGQLAPLDTGSSANFITRNLAESLNVLSALSTHRASASIKSRLDNFEKTHQFLVVPRIDSLTPQEQLNHSSIALLKNLKLANSEFDKPAPLQMIIGSGISLATLAIGQLAPLDTGSSANFITRNLAESLNNLSTLSTHRASASIKSRLDNFEKTLKCLVVPRIGSLTAQEQLNRSSIALLKNIKLADSEFDKPAPVQMLIGSGISLASLSVGQIHLSSPASSDIYLQKTPFGWIIAGSLSLHNEKEMMCHLTDPQREMSRFWEIEEGPSIRRISPEEQRCEKHFTDNTTRTPEGRHIVALPFIERKCTLGHSKPMAFRRLLALERQLNKSPELKLSNEYKSLGHMTKVESDVEDGFFLPHHAVIKTSSATTKLRIIFDESAKSSSGISLNDTLMTGPTIQDDLFSLVLTLRLHNFVPTGDIQRIYRQILVRKEDRKYQRILWREEDGLIGVYELNVVTFGLASAPFLAVRCIQQFCDDERSQYPSAAQTLKSDLYVDDYLTGKTTIREAIDLRDEAIQLLQRRGFNLRQCASNSQEVLNGLDDTQVTLNLQNKEDTTLKTLGVYWNSREDSISYTVRPIDISETTTKRSIFSKITQIFDPGIHEDGIIRVGGRLQNSSLSVRSLKHHLRAVMGNILFTLEHLNTLVIEAILNSRPLTPLSSDPNDQKALTPSHFLIGDSLMSLPQQDFSETPPNHLCPLNHLSVWQRIQQIKQDFWKRWHKEYLSELTVRRKWTHGDHPIVEGSIVLIRDDTAPPLQWRLGRVIKANPGPDGNIRVVSLKTANGVTERSVKKLAPLPLTLSNHSD